MQTTTVTASAPAPIQPQHHCPLCGQAPVKKPTAPRIRMVREGGKVIEKVGGIRI